MLMTILIGFIVGVVAKFLMPGKNEPSGFIMTTILGIAGSIVMGYILPGGGAAGFIGSVIGAMILIFVYHMITRKK